VTLTTEAEHKAAVKEFRTLATDEEAHYAQLLVLRDAIHAFEEANGHHPGPPRRLRAGCKWKCLSAA